MDIKSISVEHLQELDLDELDKLHDMVKEEQKRRLEEEEEKEKKISRKRKRSTLDNRGIKMIERVFRECNFEEDVDPDSLEIYSDGDGYEGSYSKGNTGLRFKNYLTHYMGDYDMMLEISGQVNGKYFYEKG